MIEALNAIEKEKDISKEILLEAIENSLVAACKNEYGKADNIRVNLDRETGEFHVYQDKVIVEEVEDRMLQISLAEAEVKFGKSSRRDGKSGSYAEKLRAYSCAESQAGCCAENPRGREKGVV